MMDFKMIRRLVKLVNSSNIAEIEVSEGTQTIRVRRSFEKTEQASQSPTQTSSAKVVPDQQQMSADAAAAAHEVFATEPELPPGSTAVKAPMVGTFYISPSPEASPFSSIGQKVHKGDTLCIVEAMKTMNEIPAPQDGVVRSILANNATGVEYGQTLMILDAP